MPLYRQLSLEYPQIQQEATRVTSFIMPDTSYGVMIEEGNKYYQERRFEEAKHAFKRVISHYIDHYIPEAYLNLANTLDEMREYPQAVDAHLCALSLMLATARSRGHLGREILNMASICLRNMSIVYEKLHDPVEQQAALMLAVNLDPSDPENQESCGIAFYRHGKAKNKEHDYSAAKESFKKALSFHISEELMQNVLIELSNACNASADPQGERDALEKMIADTTRKSNKLLGAFYNLTALYVNSRDFPNARRVLHLWEKTAPDDPDLMPFKRMLR